MALLNAPGENKNSYGGSNNMDKEKKFASVEEPFSREEFFEKTKAGKVGDKAFEIVNKAKNLANDGEKNERKSDSDIDVMSFDEFVDSFEVKEAEEEYGNYIPVPFKKIEGESEEDFMKRDREMRMRKMLVAMNVGPKALREEDFKFDNSEDGRNELLEFSEKYLSLGQDEYMNKVKDVVKEIGTPYERYGAAEMYEQLKDNPEALKMVFSRVPEAWQDMDEAHGQPDAEGQRRISMVAIDAFMKKYPTAVDARMAQSDFRKEVEESMNKDEFEKTFEAYSAGVDELSDVLYGAQEDYVRAADDLGKVMATLTNNHYAREREGVKEAKVGAGSVAGKETEASEDEELNASTKKILKEMIEESEESEEEDGLGARTETEVKAEEIVEPEGEKIEVEKLVEKAKEPTREVKKPEVITRRDEASPLYNRRAYTRFSNFRSGLSENKAVDSEPERGSEEKKSKIIDFQEYVKKRNAGLGEIAEKRGEETIEKGKLESEKNAEAPVVVENVNESDLERLSEGELIVGGDPWSSQVDGKEYSFTPSMVLGTSAVKPEFKIFGSDWTKIYLCSRGRDMGYGRTAFTIVVEKNEE
ncbi:hypothetical protein IKF81_01105 [Candidatus Saccharibacteria bacterium]|nr:hypothetical protein [Candidatus Saccharibacteria bacterium]